MNEIMCIKISEANSGLKEKTFNLVKDFMLRFIVLNSANGSLKFILDGEDFMSFGPVEMTKDYCDKNHQWLMTASQRVNKNLDHPLFNGGV